VPGVTIRDASASGTLSKPDSNSPTLGAYPQNAGIISTTLLYGNSPPTPPAVFQILNVRENGHWGGFGALLTLHDHGYTPGRRQYWYSSRGQGSLTEVAGSLLGSAECSITRASQGQIHDPDGTTNDLYEDQVYLNIPNYHYCSVRIEWTALSTTWHWDSSAVQSATGRSVKFTAAPAYW